MLEDRMLLNTVLLLTMFKLYSFLSQMAFEGPTRDVSYPAPLADARPARESNKGTAVKVRSMKAQVGKAKVRRIGYGRDTGDIWQFGSRHCIKYPVGAPGFPYRCLGMMTLLRLTILARIH